jgi:outer membrane lipoprotein-sorting protein
MKKIKMFFIFFGMLGLLLGCNKKEVKSENLMENLSEKISTLNEYKVNVKMECKKDDGAMTYDVLVEYKNPELYKVTIKNGTNNNYQVIVKNESGVYVLTPALNKSFKFQSNWPNNTSHVYLIQSLYNDLLNDQNRTVTNDSNYIFAESKVNSKSNSKVVKQKIVYDKAKLMPIEVIIYDKESNPVITAKYDAFDFSPNLTKLDFDVDKSNQTAKLLLGEGNVSFTDKELLTPIYTPAGVFLDSQTSTNSKAIYHYKGEVSYTVVQEFIEPSEVLYSNRIYGEPVMLEQSVGALTNNSLTWYNNGIEYMIFSTQLNTEELVKIANSFVYTNNN